MKLRKTKLHPVRGYQSHPRPPTLRYKAPTPVHPLVSIRRTSISSINNHQSKNPNSSTPSLISISTIEEPQPTRSKCSTSSLKSINSNSNMSSLTCVSSPHNSPARKQNQTSTYIPQSHPNVQSEQNKVASLGYITPDKQPNNCDTTNSTKTSILGEDTADKHSVNAQKSSILPNLLARNMKSHFQEHQPIGVSLTNGKNCQNPLRFFSSGL